MEESGKNRTKRKAIFTADDFGASDFINKGVLRGIEKGIINSVAVMVNFPGALEHIVRLKETFPRISIGLHSSITAGTPLSREKDISSLVDPLGKFFDLQEFIQRIREIRPEHVYTEALAQLEALERAGVEVEHLSSHHNLMQVYTPLFQELLRIAREKGIPMRSTRPLSRFLPPYSRSPIIQEGRKAALELVVRHTFSAIRFMKYGMPQEMQKNQDSMMDQGVPHPDFLGDSFWGDPTPENLRFILNHQPPGVTEWVFHLGSSRGLEEAPKGIDQEYFHFRELELFTICSSELPLWLEREGIEQVSFRDLG